MALGSDLGVTAERAVKAQVERARGQWGVSVLGVTRVTAGKAEWPRAGLEPTL